MCSQIGVPRIVFHNHQHAAGLIHSAICAGVFRLHINAGSGSSPEYQENDDVDLRLAKRSSVGAALESFRSAPEVC